MKRIKLPGETCRHHGFSLVELIVVIGIIALLVGILMPALTLVREQANQIKCAATLKSIGGAAASHMTEHDMYLPTCGWQWNPAGGVVNPTGLGDGNRKRFDYYKDDDDLRPLPITAALAQYMSVRFTRTLGRTLKWHCRGTMSGDSSTARAKRRNFRGGRSATAGAGGRRMKSAVMCLMKRFSGGATGIPMWRPSPAGLITKVKKSSEVFLAADGRTRDPQFDRCFLVFDFGPNDTLADFETNIQQSTLGKELIDHYRHRRKINVVFLDGHVLTFATDVAGLRNVGVSRGIH